MRGPWLHSLARRLIGTACVALAGVGLAASAGAVQIDFVTVRDTGNPGDDVAMTCCDSSAGTSGYGAVDYVYRIGTYEITTAQYAEFLNAVAASDPNTLYNNFMGARGLTRTGSDGSYSYQVDPAWTDKPIGFAHFYDAARFSNWLHNGQPLGFQDASTTEDGAYTLLGSNPLDLTHNPDARFYVPTEDEWYKAAYWDPVLGDYNLYPGGSSVGPTASLPPGGVNTANYWNGPGGPFFDDRDPDDVERVFGDPNGYTGPPICGVQSPCEATDVGSYPDSASPWGTYDQGGNHWEMVEATTVDGQVARGGSWQRRLGDLGSFVRTTSPIECNGCGAVGFRIGSPVPEPASGLLFALGLLMLHRRARARSAGSH